MVAHLPGIVISILDYLLKENAIGSRHSEFIKSEIVESNKIQQLLEIIKFYNTMHCDTYHMDGAQS